MDNIEPNELLVDLPNEDYHAQWPRDQHFYSSSQLKDILKDPEIFYRKYITGELPPEKKTVFDVGTYVHTALLEPHLLETECAVFPGASRNAKKFKEFQAENEGKAIITKTELIDADMAIQATKNSPICMELINGGDKELSLFLEDFHGIRVKVRFDVIHLGSDYSYIADVKTTTGNVMDAWDVRNKVTNMGYDFSGALYVDVINEWIRQNDLDVAYVDEFWLLFCNKKAPQAKAWCQSSKMLEVGRRKYLKAIELLKKYEQNEWVFEEQSGVLDPLPWEAQEWLEENNEDL